MGDKARAFGADADAQQALRRRLLEVDPGDRFSPNKDRAKELADDIYDLAIDARSFQDPAFGVMRTKLATFTEQPKLRAQAELEAAVKTALAEYQAGLAAIASASGQGMIDTWNATAAKRDELEELAFELKLRLARRP